MTPTGREPSGDPTPQPAQDAQTEEGEALIAEAVDLMGRLDLAQQAHRDPEHVHTSHYALMLALATPRTATPTALPDADDADDSDDSDDAAEPASARDCFRTAVLATHGRPDRLYVEGFAAFGFLPTPHAWVLDPATDAIYDPTWAALARTGTAVYIGLPFATAFMHAHTHDNPDHVSVIESDHARDFRALRDGFTLDTHGVVTAYGPTNRPQDGLTG